jgi:hypothetical protein
MYNEDASPPEPADTVQRRADNLNALKSESKTSLAHKETNIISD